MKRTSMSEQVHPSTFLKLLIAPVCIPAIKILPPCSGYRSGINAIQKYARIPFEVFQVQSHGMLLASPSPEVTAITPGSRTILSFHFLRHFLVMCDPVYRTAWQIAFYVVICIWRVTKIKQFRRLARRSDCIREIKIRFAGICPLGAQLSILPDIRVVAAVSNRP